MEHTIPTVKRGCFDSISVADFSSSVMSINCMASLYFAETLDITTGVPQGSILGPLLFIVYINDLPNASKIFHSIMYADDTNLSASLQSIKSTNPNETVDTLINKELSKISEWLGLNKLSLNVKKSKYIVHKMTNKKS